MSAKFRVHVKTVEHVFTKPGVTAVKHRSSLFFPPFSISTGRDSMTAIVITDLHYE